MMEPGLSKTSFEGSWDELMARKELFSGKLLRVEVIDSSAPDDYQTRYRVWREKLRALPDEPTPAASSVDHEQLLDDILVEKYRKQGIRF